MIFGGFIYPHGIIAMAMCEVGARDRLYDGPETYQESRTRRAEEAPLGGFPVFGP